VSANAGDETSAVKVFGFGVFNGGLPNSWVQDNCQSYTVEHEFGGELISYQQFLLIAWCANRNKDVALAVRQVACEKKNSSLSSFCQDQE
jgi:hypothetical protein